MKIGIIGSGEVGVTLAKGFLKHGYEVMISTNTPAKLEELKKKTDGNAKTGSFEDAAKFGELIVLTVKGGAAEAAVKKLGATHLTGKTVIDTSNPIADAAPVNGVLSYFTSLSDSLLERLQKAVPQAHFVKAFNSIGNGLMVNPNFGGTRPTMFICGNESGAKKQVSQILEQFGFEPEDMGGVEAARAIEPLCMLWCIPGLLRNDWKHAFKLLK